MDTQMIGMCGAYCAFCDWKDRMDCPGCQTCAGKPFWGDCAVAQCALKGGHTHCGTCHDLPCPQLQDAFNHPEHGDNGERLLNLKNWAQGKDTCVRLTTLGKNENL